MYKRPQFSDDVAVYTKCKTVKRGAKILENAIEKIRKKLLILGLELTPSKTKFIHFNNKRIAPGNTEIQVHETKIKSTDKTRFLGIIFDYKMSFSQHIDLTLNKCTKALNIVKFLRDTWWGSSPSTLITLYKSFIRPIIDYASFIYFPSSKNKIEKLEGIQYVAIRLALGFRNSTRINILLAESKLTTLESRAKFLCNCFLVKNLSNISSLTSQTINKFYFFIISFFIYNLSSFDNK